MNRSLRWGALGLSMILSLSLVACGGKAAAPAAGSAPTPAPAPSASPATGSSPAPAPAPAPAPGTSPAPAPSGDAGDTGCLLALPAKAPAGFTEVGRDVQANKNASWSLKDADGNTYTVAIIFKADAAAATKSVEVTKSIYSNPGMTAAKFNGCDAFQRAAKGGDGKNEVRVIYAKGPQVVNLTALGPTASPEQLAKVGRGSGNVTM